MFSIIENEYFTIIDYNGTRIRVCTKSNRVLPRSLYWDKDYYNYTTIISSTNLLEIIQYSFILEKDLGPTYIIFVSLSFFNLVM